MFKHILIATDGSERSERAIRLGVDLAKSVGAKITAVMALWPIPPIDLEGVGGALPNQALEQYMLDHARRCLAVAKDVARAAGLDWETLHVVETRPYEAIISTAESRLCDLIVMASHGRASSTSLLLGSETQKVLAHTSIPVLVCR